MPITIEPGGLHPVADSEWEEIEVAVDNGAIETVLGPDTLTSVPITSGPAVERGVEYEVPEGVQIPDQDTCTMVSCEV